MIRRTDHFTHDIQAVETRDQRYLCLGKIVSRLAGVWLFTALTRTGKMNCHWKYMLPAIADVHCVLVSCSDNKLGLGNRHTNLHCRSSGLQDVHSYLFQVVTKHDWGMCRTKIKP
ncbi:hypothetical protein MPTK1_7g00500 [Marchantia polymorpha subsp. ruderalis]|uniref:Uncharacterized protein n=2 Tax=Marchantia polymorpha TaxID=3197 RepID=A0AAF6BUS0_MARPO|nr:hypothetical protein MARPO_0046s0075 [Marchantia polymorpha]BBN15754.1 hypothetical protein Mp_7g00500 [Marchantia polymorpha subsp. ruderalis]|eukprot:PTQ39254.1 hypothetical protein MARPO_0046s0075 [Marchantia polymorpha]